MRSVLTFVTAVAIVASHSRLEAQQTHSISNGDITIGVSLNWGGSIVRLDYRMNEIMRINNVNNSGGPGRQIEAAIYDNESQSQDCWPVIDNCQPNPSCSWKWNPVQAGDACGSGSGGTVLSQTATRIVTRTTPIQWNPYWPTPSNVELEQDLEIISPRLVRVTYTITNNESFTVNSEHELPVAYLSASYETGLYYEGGAPWTRDMNVTQRMFSNGDKSNSVNPTEPWIGFSDVVSGCAPLNCATIMLYVPSLIGSWNMGRMEDGVSLLQAWQDRTLTPGQTKTVTAYIAVGTFTEARDAVYAHSGH
jgi:hypothetical protein